MKCRVCGCTKLVKDMRDHIITKNKKNFVVKNIKGLYCNSCGDAVFNKEESKIFLDAINNPLT